MRYVDSRKMEIARLVEIDGFTTDDIYSMIGVAEQGRGDYALPCFRFARTFRKSPPQIAQELAERIGNPEGFDKVEAVAGYLNFTLARDKVIKEIVEEIVEKGSEYGSSDIGKGKTICIDYSSVNIAKPFHMGHLATTAIGAALYRMYGKMGFEPVGINHLGDWGTQFGKLIVACKKFSKGGIIPDNVKELNALYVKFHDEAELDPSLDDEARAWFKKIEDGDEEANGYFEKFKEVTLAEVKKLYERLDVHFDSWAGESFYNDKMAPYLKMLEDLNLLEESEGAKVVNLERWGMPPCLLVKADGATLYATRDIATAFYRKQTYDFYKSLYIVAYQQNLHFQQLFKVLELMGQEWAKDMIHVPFGMVSLESGSLSTRKGNVVLLTDVLDRAVERCKQIIQEKNPDLESKDDAAEKIGVGAVVFSALSSSRIKDTVFSYDKVLNFDGETGPYLQYSNARCLSVLRKAGEYEDLSDISEKEIKGIADPHSADLAMLLGRYPFVIYDALEKHEPSMLSRYLIDVAKTFNKFYMENRILNAEEEFVRPRLALVKATSIVIENGLSLLGISCPEEM